MNAKRFVIGTLVGGAAVLATAYLIFALPPFRDFFIFAMNTGSATGVAREPALIWAVAVGALSYSALVTFVIGIRPGSVNIGSGIKIGAIVGFLLWLTADFMFYGISNVGNLTTTVVDPLLELVPGAAAGAAVSAVLGRIP